MPKKILIVDDEKDIVDLISYNLEKEGFTALKAYNGERALKLVDEKRPDLVILDLMLPGMRGLEVCKFIRKNPETETLPIIMLTAKGDQVDKILGLEMGADDYITKPFSLRELAARVRAVLRRRSDGDREGTTPVYRGRHIVADFEAVAVQVDGEPIRLTRREFELLRYLVANKNRVLSRDSLLERVW
ncbi:MAG: response regulator transcription factor, partial [Syntrophales bacterium]